MIEDDRDYPKNTQLMIQINTKKNIGQIGHL